MIGDECLPPLSLFFVLFYFVLLFIFNAGPISVLLPRYFGKSIPGYLLPKVQ